MHPIQPLTIWTNAQFPSTIQSMLLSGAPAHRIVIASQTSASNLVKSQPDAALEEAEIAFGQPDADQLMQLSKIRWVHLTSAGYTAYDRSDLKQVFRERGIALTTSSGVYNEPCAEHVLAMMLSMARQLPFCLDEQRGPRAWSAADVRRQSFLLKDQRVILFGYGEIAKRLAELLAPFGVELVGVRRTPQGNESIRVISLQEADEWIGKADHVINILPANGDSQGYFDELRLSKIRPDAIFYNIGRGTTVDQSALAALLNAGRIAAAYLDVTQPEPLPPTDPLWNAKNCFITPHSAGGFRDEMERLVAHFLENLALFQSGQPLRNRVI